MPDMHTPKPVVLCILDGWGHSESAEHNAIAKAHTPFWDTLEQRALHSRIRTSGLDVGLPEGQMGNSEVGHMNIGSGRVVMQDLPRIDQAIRTGELAANPLLQQAIVAMKNKGGKCHLLGLLSPGGVHSHQHHIAALAKIIAEAGVKVEIHAFLDGRDTPPSSALEYLTQFEEEIAGVAGIRIATVSGRYYAMDRDNRWDRVELCYNALVSATALNANSWEQAIRTSYYKNKTDEFVLPVTINNYHGMADGDGIIMGNFRADRAREIMAALCDDGFKGFERERQVQFSARLGMVEYSTDHNRYLTTLFPPERLTNILGEIISKRGLKQLRIAETEKYAHVTFFFNGGEETPFPGEDRILVPSPKVATYDLQPEMSAPEVTDKLVTAIEAGTYDVIIVNYANTDMVGHTGVESAAIKAVEAIDTCLSRLVPEVENAGGVICITADHGNAEKMQDEETGQPHTAHTVFEVPLVVVGKGLAGKTLKNGRLADIAPTLLKLMGIEQPSEMTGETLIA